MRPLPFHVPILAVFLCATPAYAAECMSWCTLTACSDLVDYAAECSGCNDEHRCHPGAEDFVAKPIDGPEKQDKVSGDGNENLPPVEWEYTAIGEPIEWGRCDVEVVRHEDVTREWILERDMPAIIRGATENWTAFEEWSLENMLTKYGKEPYHLIKANTKRPFEKETESGLIPLEELLKTWKYWMGHTLPEGHCYHSVRRPYSPFMQVTLGKHYDVPDYLKPMKTFQMGIGVGGALGVVPESHPSAWWVQVKGRKRWILSPPSSNAPYKSINNKILCQPKKIPSTAVLCDAQFGDIMWVPNFWWHETCGLDPYSVGMGGVTYKGCESEKMPCHLNPGDYELDEIPICAENHDANCPTIEEVGAAPNMKTDVVFNTTINADEPSRDVLWPLKQNPAIPEWLRPFLQTIKKKRVLLELLKEYAPDLSKKKKSGKSGASKKEL